DIRTDLPKYRVYKHGVLTDEVIDIKPYWRDVSTVVITQYHAFAITHAPGHMLITDRRNDTL
ncbi:hypothetical protein B5M09_006143, partial [Aphanomyces astaci]